MLRASTWSRRPPPAGGDVEDAAARDALEAGDADVVGDRLLADQAIAAVLRHQAEPERHRGVGAADRCGDAVDEDRALAPARARRRRRRAPPRCSPPRAGRTGPRPRPGGRRGRAPATRRPSVRDRRRSSPRSSSATSPSGAVLAALRRRRIADHLGDDVLARHGPDRVPAADAAVAHDHDAVADREDLRQAVRDEDDRDAPRLQRAHPVEQALRLVLGQRRGRLVEDEQPRPLGQRAGDDHELLAWRGRASPSARPGSRSRPKSRSAWRARRSRPGTSIRPQRVGSSLR